MKLASRRAVLALGGGSALALIAGCSVDSLPIVGPPDPDDELRSAVAASEQELIAAYDAAIAAGRESGALLRTLRQQHVEHLAAVTAPTLILVGTEDRMTPPDLSRALHAGLPDSTLTTLDGAGHMLMLEQEAAVMAELDTFLKTHSHG